MNKPILLYLAADSRVTEAIILSRVKELPGLEVRPFRAAAALEAEIRSRKPRLCLIEVDLEGKSGIEICRDLSGAPDTCDLPVILFSSTEADRTEAMSAGASGFLGFPFLGKELEELARKCLDSTKRILVVDDSKVIHSLIENALAGEPYELTHAMNGKEGLETLRRSRPDLIITDVEMPVMNGYELCAAAKRDPATTDIPILMSSTMSEGVNIDKGFDVGANDYLTKPYVPSDLLSKIRSIFDQSLRNRREAVLVVDDSKVIQTMLVHAMSGQGFRTFTASDGVEGLAAAKKRRPALILTDLEMPRMNGRDMVREIRKQPDLKTVPIIMLTTRDTDLDKAKAANAGISAFVAKPFATDKVLVLAERLIAESKLRRERDSMRMYVSESTIEHAEQVAKQGLTTESGMSATKKDVAILFSDVCGFTLLCEGRSPEEIVALLNQYYDLMVTVLIKNNAVIDKFIGDAIMATFAGKDSQTNAYLAAKAGFEMLQALGSLNAERTDAKDHLHVRIGINTGPVIMGDLGSRLHRRDFTVIGDNVNIAQRLEGQSPKDSVLISDSTYQLIEGWVTVETVGSISVKGKDEKVLCHVLKAIRERRAAA